MAMGYDELAEQLRYPDDPAMQELFVQTFEFDPGCTLEIGWHLFGENYERGEFLVRMRQLLRRYGISEGAELPDHLTYLLRLIARIEHDEAAALAGQFVLPALEKIKLPEGNAYRPVLEAIRKKLRADFPEAPRGRVELPVIQEAICE